MRWRWATAYHYFYVTLANGASVGDEYFNHTTGRYDFASLSGFLKHVRTFIDDGSMFPGYESMNGDTARAQFSAGNIGMIGPGKPGTGRLRGTRRESVPLRF